MNKICTLFINNLNFSQNVALQQVRTAFVVKRRYPPLLLRQGEGSRRRLRNKYFIYDLVKDTDMDKQPEIPLILTQFVKKYGNPGEKIFVKSISAYEHFLLPKLAVYATPENEEKYKYKENLEKVCSSPTAQIFAVQLSEYCLTVQMHKDNPWTLKPWHIKTNLRKVGIHVPEANIEIPRTINGPNKDYENKEFYVIITINNFEKVKLRCQLQHCATNIVDPLIKDEIEDFIIQKSEPIFPEDAEVLNAMPPVDAEIKFSAT